MGVCYGGTDVMERSCAVARGIDTSSYGWTWAWDLGFLCRVNAAYRPLQGGVACRHL
jgi:hypothetical protein